MAKIYCPDCGSERLSYDILRDVITCSQGHENRPQKQAAQPVDGE